jgi:DNA-binding NtrC family response regulator
MSAQTAAPLPGRLLVLDDDDLVGLLVETVGRLSGMNTRLCRAPEDFFAAMAAEAASHVVIDLNMPAMSGEQVLQELAQRQCRARIIVCSGADPGRLAAASALAMALGLDIAGTLPKPFLPAALRRLLQPD